jgi:hypothetical protein
MRRQALGNHAFEHRDGEVAAFVAGDLRQRSSGTRQGHEVLRIARLTHRRREAPLPLQPKSNPAYYEQTAEKVELRSHGNPTFPPATIALKPVHVETLADLFERSSEGYTCGLRTRSAHTIVGPAVSVEHGDCDSVRTALRLSRAASLFPGPKNTSSMGLQEHLLYVACTRACDDLLVTSVKPASEFLNDMLN